MVKVSFGAIQYFWSWDKVQDFYRQAAESDVDVIYLGENVCPKRRALTLSDYMEIAYQLRDAGKQVVLSGLTLLESPADVRELKKICDNGEFVVEANDMGAVQLLSEKGLPFVGGGALNCYNAAAINRLVALGMMRLVLPVELHKQWLTDLLNAPDFENTRDTLELELFVFGHIPLAWSARCFTARSENRPKDSCDLCCGKYPAGRLVKSQEGDAVFVLNGIQTQSGYRQNLLSEVANLQGKIDIFRISPQCDDTFYWLEKFKSSGESPYVLQSGECNGYWFGEAGIKAVDMSCDKS